jgi:hypothetical protein
MTMAARAAVREEDALETETARVPVPLLVEPAPARRFRARVGRRALLGRELIGEIQGLQPVLQELVQQYEMRITAQLAEIVRGLNGDESGRLPRFPAVKASTAMLRAIHATELKPRKGRAKDLVRLHELVALLTELLPPQE